jgi:hypothetical protein
MENNNEKFIPRYKDCPITYIINRDEWQNTPPFRFLICYNVIGAGPYTHYVYVILIITTDLGNIGLPIVQVWLGAQASNSMIPAMYNKFLFLHKPQCKGLDIIPYGNIAAADGPAFADWDNLPLYFPIDKYEFYYKTPRQNFYDSGSWYWIFNDPQYLTQDRWGADAIWDFYTYSEEKQRKLIKQLMFEYFNKYSTLVDGTNVFQTATYVEQNMEFHGGYEEKRTVIDQFNERMQSGLPISKARPFIDETDTSKEITDFWGQFPAASGLFMGFVGGHSFYLPQGFKVDETRTQLIQKMMQSDGKLDIKKTDVFGNPQKAFVVCQDALNGKVKCILMAYQFVAYGKGAEYPIPSLSDASYYMKKTQRTIYEKVIVIKNQAEASELGLKMAPIQDNVSYMNFFKKLMS